MTIGQRFDGRVAAVIAESCETTPSSGSSSASRPQEAARGDHGPYFDLRLSFVTIRPAAAVWFQRLMTQPDREPGAAFRNPMERMAFFERRAWVQSGRWSDMQFDWWLTALENSLNLRSL